MSRHITFSACRMAAKDKLLMNSQTTVSQWDGRMSVAMFTPRRLDKVFGRGILESHVIGGNKSAQIE